MEKHGPSRAFFFVYLAIFVVVWYDKSENRKGDKMDKKKLLKFIVFAITIYACGILIIQKNILDF